jgi:hypothetical protein
MKLLINGIIARAQRDNKIVLCHYIWMGNHAHILAVFNDPNQAVKFYAEVQKKLTEAIKALLGLPHLRMWEGRPVVAPVLDLPAAIEQLAYLYANPARANLIDSISLYPGSSSWALFQELVASQSHQVSAKITREALWVPSSRIPILPEPALKMHADIDFTHLIAKKGVPHVLELYPNAWMGCFGISCPEQVARLNQKVLQRIAEKEQEHRKKRVEEKKGVLGEKLLRVQPINRAHTPKDRLHRRRVFVICSDKDTRINFIKKVKALCRLARRYYRDALKGIQRDWPPGMFKPPIRALASALG